jgi:hypothetical protein
VKSDSVATSGVHFSKVSSSISVARLLAYISQNITMNAAINDAHHKTSDFLVELAIITTIKQKNKTFD